MLSMRDWGRDCWCESGIDNTCGYAVRKIPKLCNKNSKKLVWIYDEIVAGNIE